MYQPTKPDKGAALNFHLSAREKIDILGSLYSKGNKENMVAIKKMLQ
jgi:hypothetical protein